MSQTYQLLEQEHQAHLIRKAGGQQVEIDGEVVTAEMDDRNGSEKVITINGKSERIHLIQHGDEIYIHARGASYQVHSVNALDILGQSTEGQSDISTAPMPGTVVSVKAQAGDTVKKGDTMVVIESMKMETAINATRDGIIQTVHVSEGDTFEKLAELVTLEAEEEA